jgi:UDP-glucuronate decarboxylase
MVKMMNSRDDFYGPVNLGNPIEMTVGELAGVIIELTGSVSGIVYRPLPSDDPVQRRPVIDLAKRELYWEPEVSLREGLARTIPYFRDVVFKE